MGRENHGAGKTMRRLGAVLPAVVQRTVLYHFDVTQQLSEGVSNNSDFFIQFFVGICRPIRQRGSAAAESVAGGELEQPHPPGKEGK